MSFTRRVTLPTGESVTVSGKEIGFDQPGYTLLDVEEGHHDSGASLTVDEIIQANVALNNLKS
jgi:hypothetical protein